MRTHATGSFNRSMFGLACLCVLGLAAFLGSSAPSVGAATGDPCANATVRFQQGSGFLPECRAYEMVSPPLKNGLDVFLGGANQVATTDGGGVFWEAFGILPGAQGGQAISPAFSTRGQTGWTSKVMTPPMPGVTPGVIGQGGYYQGHSLNISRSVLKSTAALTPDAPLGNGGNDETNLYLRDNSTETYQLINPVLSNYAQFVSGSRDFSHLAYISTGAQVPDDPNGSTITAFEWTQGSGVRLVGILPDPDGSGPLTEEPAPGATVLGGGASEEVNVGPVEFTSALNTVSADGSKIVFSHDPPGEGLADLELYTREDGEVTHADSASQRTDCVEDPTCGGDNLPDPEPDPAGSQLPTYLTTSLSGDRVLFMSCEKLTDDSTATTVGSPACMTANASNDYSTPLSGSGKDLYMFEVSSGQLRDLTTADPAGGNVIGVSGVSHSGDRIYFVARGDLAPGATAGARNLYLWHDDDVPGGEIDWITTLSEEDGQAFDALWGNHNGWMAEGVRVTADGRFLAFASKANVTGYDSDGHREIYRFDAETGQTACASCNPSGDPATSAASLTGEIRSFWEPLGRNVTDDGRVYFETADPLVTKDSNGKVDVYQWDDGVLTLISSGQSDGNSNFTDTTPDGSSVFFTTRESLVGADTGRDVDLYVARVGGGFPEPIPGPPCEGDSCQPPPLVPNDPTPASSTTSGPGNPRVRSDARRCPAGKKRVKRRGKVRCVVRKKHLHKIGRAGK